MTAWNVQPTIDELWVVSTARRLGYLEGAFSIWQALCEHTELRLAKRAGFSVCAVSADGRTCRTDEERGGCLLGSVGGYSSLYTGCASLIDFDRTLGLSSLVPTDRAGLLRYHWDRAVVSAVRRSGSKSIRVCAPSGISFEYFIPRDIPLFTALRVGMQRAVSSLLARMLLTVAERRLRRPKCAMIGQER